MNKAIEGESRIDFEETVYCLWFVVCCSTKPQTINNKPQTMKLKTSTPQ